MLPDKRLETSFIPVPFVTKQPKGWMASVLRQNKRNISSSEGDFVVSAQERWLNRTGVEARDSKCTIAVPIHNEQNLLPSFLDSFRLMDLPYNAPIVVAFITNGCTDKSPQIVDSFMCKMAGEVTEQQLLLGDSGQRQPAKIARVQNVTFIHVDTVTRGKANALKIGNELAISSGHRIAMSIDANNYPEPNALAELYKLANYHFEAEKDSGTVLVSGFAIGVRRPAFQNLILDRGTNKKRDISEGCFSVNGWLMAWDTEWLKSIGGPPQVAIEDYALGVMARLGGFQMRKVPEAVIWGFIPNNFKDALESRIRYIRGRFQLMELFPSTEGIIRADYFFMRETFTNRVKSFLEELGSIKASPFQLMRKIGSFLLWEYALNEGYRQYLDQPLNQSWLPLQSTK